MAAFSFFGVLFIIKFGQHLLQPFDAGGLQDVLHGHVAAAAAEGALLLHEGAGLGLGTYRHRLRMYVGNKVLVLLRGG